MLGRLRFRGRIGLLVTVPLLAVFMLTVPVVVNRVTLADRIGDTARSVRVATQVGNLLQVLQEERLLMVGHVLTAVDRPSLVRQAATVTDSIADVRTELGHDLPSDVARALDSLDGLAALRTAVLAGQANPVQIITTYGAMTNGIINSLHLGDRIDLGTPSGRVVKTLDTILRLNEGTNGGLTTLALAAATQRPEMITQIAVILSGMLALAHDLQTFATPEQIQLYELVLQGFDARLGVDDFRTRFPIDPVGVIRALSLPTLFPTLESFITLTQSVQHRIASEASAGMATQEERILIAAYGAATLSVLVLLCVVVLSVATARAVVAPLSRLTFSANRVAAVTEAELERVADDEAESPEAIRLDPIDVWAKDEIGELARAFERVQGTAVRLVERQVSGRRNVAQMFGHVGRRTQNLVGRQIALIDQLEREETDPRRLQQLYRLDHVSSRLRRSAGSLVVLSGTSGVGEHIAPLPLADVVRLSLAEIEDYVRVDVDVAPGYAVAPRVIADLVLVIAEVLENATVFSPPHSRVTVTASQISWGVRLRVIDHGIGMSPERIAEENARFTRRERLDLVPTEVLGLFVVGRLVRRHGLGVTLTGTPGGGVTATIDIDEDLLASGPTNVSPLPAGLNPVPTRSGPRHELRTAAGEPRSGPPLRPLARRGDPGRGEQPIDQALARAAELVSRYRQLGFSAIALDRASRSLSNGPHWNAFALTRHSSGLAQEPTPIAFDVPVAGVPAQLPPASAAAPEDDRSRPTRSRGGLSQRVPGQQLPLGAFSDWRTEPTGTAPDAQAQAGGLADPARARALVEEYEAGIRQAETHSGSFPAPPHARFPSALAVQLSDAVITPPVTAAAAPPVVGSAAPVVATAPVTPRTTPPLIRRVPGASLDVPARGPAPSNGPGFTKPPPDPDAARMLFEQFEEGVTQALRQVGSLPRTDSLPPPTHPVQRTKDPEDD